MVVMSVNLAGTEMFMQNIDNKKFCEFVFEVQSTLFISKLKGPSETLRDIRTSTYKIFRIEENTNRTTKFHN